MTTDRRTRTELRGPLGFFASGVIFGANRRFAYGLAVGLVLGSGLTLVALYLFLDKKVP